jgi:hypothetical protein
MSREDLPHARTICDIGNEISPFDLGIGSGMLQVEERVLGVVNTDEL